MQEVVTLPFLERSMQVQITEFIPNQIVTIQKKRTSRNNAELLIFQFIINLFLKIKKKKIPKYVNISVPRT